jgi:hypothetical protein
MWLMVRDTEIYRPWFDGRVAAQRETQGNFDADWLHDQTFALMASRETYHRLPRAAYSMDIGAEVALATTPVHIADAGNLESLIHSIVLGTGEAP